MDKIGIERVCKALAAIDQNDLQAIVDVFRAFAIRPGFLDGFREGLVCAGRDALAANAQTEAILALIQVRQILTAAYRHEFAKEAIRRDG